MIFQTNMATSYAAGRWAQINDPDLADFRPYIKYHSKGNDQICFAFTDAHPASGLGA